MATNTDTNTNLSTKCTDLLNKLATTRNLRVLGLVVKAATARRDELRGRDVAAVHASMDAKLGRIAEHKTAKRARALMHAVAALTERKDVAAVVATAIARRKVARAKS